MLGIFYFLIMLIFLPVYLPFLINHHQRKSHLTEKSFPSRRNKKIIANIPSRQAIHSLPSKRIDSDSHEWINQVLFFRIGEPRAVKTLIDSSTYRISAAEDARDWTGSAAWEVVRVFLVSLKKGSISHFDVYFSYLEWHRWFIRLTTRGVLSTTRKFGVSSTTRTGELFCTQPKLVTMSFLLRRIETDRWDELKSSF